MRLVNRFCFAVLAGLVLVGSALGARDPGPSAAWPSGTAVVSYESDHALAAALARHPARIVRRIGALHVAALRPEGSVERFAQRIGAEPGIVRVERATARRSHAEPALAAPAPGLPYQWQFAAVRADQVPPAVSQAAAAFTIAVIDTGADLGAPDLSAKAPQTYSLRSGQADVTDTNGHGTFVAALAGGSSTNGDGIAGLGGDARLMVVQAGGAGGAFTDVDEAAAIVYAIDHGARIVNLSLGGPSTSSIEKRAVDYAVSKGALLVAAVGNDYLLGNAVEYPAALLQPVGSRGIGGSGLAVAASTIQGARARFSSTGSHVSLAAPGVGVFSAVSSSSPLSNYPRTVLPGSAGGVYGYASGTSFAAPQVAGAAALVWAANPELRADEVASVLEQTATGHGQLEPRARLRRARRRRGSRQGTGDALRPGAGGGPAEGSGRPRAAAREARRHARRPLVACVGERRTLPRLRAVGAWPAARSDRSRHPAERRLRPRSGRVQLHRRRARR